MKLRMFAVAAIAGIVVVGCNQESSVDSPVAEHQSSAISKTAIVPGGQSIKLDQGVWDESYEEKYLVSGTVYCEINSTGGNYSFFQITKLVVTNCSVEEQPSIVAVKYSTSGTVGGETVELSQDYSLEGSPKDRSLRINFRLNFELGEERVEIASMEIVSGS